MWFLYAVTRFAKTVSCPSIIAASATCLHDFALAVAPLNGFRNVLPIGLHQTYAVITNAMPKPFQHVLPAVSIVNVAAKHTCSI